MALSRIVKALAAALVCASPAAAQAAQVVMTSGEIVSAHLSGRPDMADLSIDRVTLTVSANTAVSFDVLAAEGAMYGLGDLNEDGEITSMDTRIRLYTLER